MQRQQKVDKYTDGFKRKHKGVLQRLQLSTTLVPMEHGLGVPAAAAPSGSTGKSKAAALLVRLRRVS